MLVNARNCMKDKVTGCYLTKETNTQRNTKTNPRKDKKKPNNGLERNNKTKETTITKFRTKYTLFDTGANVNSLSYESWEVNGKPTLVLSTTILTSFVEESTPVEGYLDLRVFIGNTNVHHRFYVMKPGKLTSQIILGQPWQRTYNGISNWRR